MFGEKYLKESYHFIVGTRLKWPQWAVGGNLGDALEQFFILWSLKKIYQNKGHGGVGLRETFGPETAEIENIVWQTINGVFEEVLNPEYFKRTVEKNPWTWTLRQVFNSSLHLIGRKNSIFIGRKNSILIGENRYRKELKTYKWNGWDDQHWIGWKHFCQFISNKS